MTGLRDKFFHKFHSKVFSGSNVFALQIKALAFLFACLATSVILLAALILNAPLGISAGILGGLLLTVLSSTLAASILFLSFTLFWAILRILELTLRRLLELGKGVTISLAVLSGMVSVLLDEVAKLMA